MARSIYNIDFYTLVNYRDILREDGNTSFPFNVIVVENQFTEIFRLPDEVCLVNHAVHDGCLAVVDMRDNRNVPNVHKLTSFFPLIQKCKITQFFGFNELFILFLQ